MGTGVDALPYVDTLIKEYLLFRGFSATLSAFTKDLAADPGCGFQAERITDMIFRQLIPILDCQQLVEFLEYLNMQLYSRLDSRHEPLVSAVEADLLRLYLVTAHNARRPDKMAEFFRLYGPQLISSSSRGSSAANCGAWGLADAAAADWKEWFLLPYLQNPEREPRFQLYFSAEWASLLEVSFRNFIAGVVRSLPLPAVLRFNTDRRLRLALQQQVHALQSELQQTKEQLAATAATLQQLQQITLNTHPQQQGSEASLEQSSQHTQQQQQQQEQEQVDPSAAGGSRQHRRDPSLGDWQHKLHTVKSSSTAGAAGSTAAFNLPTDLQPGCDAPSPAAAAGGGGGGLDEGQELQEFPPRTAQGGSGLFELLPQHSSGVVGVVPGSSSSNSGSTSSGGQGGTLQQQQQQQQQQSGLPSRHVRGASFSGSISFDATSAAAGGDDGASKPQEALGVLPLVDSLNPGPDVASTGPHQQMDPGELHEQFSPQGQPVTIQEGAPVTKSPSGKPLTAATAAAAAAGLPPALATGSLPIAAPSSRAMPTPRNSSSSSGMGGAVLSSSPVLSWAGGSSSGAPGVRGLTRHLPPGHAAAAAAAAAAGGSGGSGAGGMGGGVGGLSGGLPVVPPVPLEVLTAVAVGDGSVSVSYQQHQGSPADAAAATAAVTAAAGAASGGGGGGGGEVVAVAFSPSGGNVASVVGGSSSVAIWSPAGLPGNAARAAVVSCGAPVTCVAWDSRADKLMLIGCAAAGGVRAWHADTRRIMDSVPAEPGFPVVAAVAACPSEPTFVVAANSSSSSNGSQPLQGRLVTYNARSFKRSSVLNVPGDTGLASLAYNSSGSQLLVGTTAGTALLFEPNSRSSPVRVWQVAAAVAHSDASGSAAASSSASSAAAAVSGEDDADLAVQVLWRPAGGQQVSFYTTSSSSSSGGGPGPAAAGSGSKGPAAGGAGGAGSGGGSMLTLCGGVLCEWVLSAASRPPVVAFDLAATARAVVAELQGLDPLSEDPEGLSPWHCCAAVSPDGSSLAVLCCTPASGVLLLLSGVSSADQSQSVWASKARVLLAGSMLSCHAHNCAGAISWHPAGGVLVVGGSEGNSIVVRLGD